MVIINSHIFLLYLYVYFILFFIQQNWGLLWVWVGGVKSDCWLSFGLFDSCPKKDISLILTVFSWFVSSFFFISTSFYFFFQESLIREQGQQHDEMYYLWALSFFMAFNRGNGCRPELVSETLSIRTFHFIEKNITNYYEMMLTDRKEATSWSRRWEWALCCCSITFYHINKWGEFSL